jgi:cytochrome c biogenesis protein CcmG/thiol:disulfide interchange protein DsbE
MRIMAAMLLTLLTMIMPAFAQDRLPLLKIDDTIYSNVLVLRVTATDIYFSSANGIGNAKLTSLEPALQAKYAPDAAKSAEVEKIQNDANSQYLRAIALQAPPPVPADAESEKSTADGSSISTTKTNLPKSFLNQKGPDLMVDKWISAAPNMQGKCVLIEFWASWSQPCLKYIPDLNSLLQQFGDRLSIVAISSDSEDDVRKVADPAIEYSSAIDPQKRMEAAVEIKDIPYVLLMDPSGIVRWEGDPLKTGKQLTATVVSSVLDKFGTNVPAPAAALPAPTPPTTIYQ